MNAQIRDHLLPGALFAWTKDRFGHESPWRIGTTHPYPILPFEFDRSCNVGVEREEVGWLVRSRRSPWFSWRFTVVAALFLGLFPSQDQLARLFRQFLKLGGLLDNQAQKLPLQPETE